MGHPALVVEKADPSARCASLGMTEFGLEIIVL
jgi:hypothetical protein